MKYVLIIYLMFSVFICSLALLLYQNSTRILFTATSKDLITLTFNSDISRAVAEQTVAHLKNKYALQSAEIHSSEKQYADFIKSFSMYSPGAFDSEEILQLIPIVVDFTGPDHQKATELKKLLISENVFEPVDSSTSWVTKLEALATFIENIGRFLFLFLFTGAALMTSATVRILVSQDEEKIKIYSYLGESFAAIRKKYFIKTMASAALGIAGGFAINAVLFKYFTIQLARHTELSFLADRVRFLSPLSGSLVLLAFLLAIILGVILIFKKLHDRIYDED